MKIEPMLVLAATMGVLAGCASSPSGSATHQPYVKPGLIMLTADQAERRGIELKPLADQPMAAALQALDSAAVIAPADVKVYTLGRAVDSVDTNLMHEEHVVYRRETTPAWRLNAPADQKILVGPRATDGRQEIKPLLDKELTTYLSDQRRATETNQQAIAALFKAIEALSRQQQAVLEHEQRKTTPGEQSGAAATPPSTDSTPHNSADAHD
jgi:hypothetical protein